MRLATLAVLLVAVSTTTVAQTANEEIARLKDHLGVPQETHIALADTPALPNAPVLKVYIATGLDAFIHTRFLDWIESWNKKGEGKKYGHLEAVADITQADVVLSRYTLAEQAHSSTYSVPGSATVYDPSKNATVTAPITRVYSYETVPLYAYILRRTPTGFEILYRDVTRTYPGEFKSAGYNLRDEFKRLMKQRAKR
jgi:hypothetical protein